MRVDEGEIALSALAAVPELWVIAFDPELRITMAAGALQVV